MQRRSMVIQPFLMTIARLVARLITHLGDLTVWLPLIVGILIWLVRDRKVSDVGWWLIAVAICVGLTTLGKAYFLGCPWSDIRHPSGHTSLSTLVYGGISLIIATRLPMGWKRLSVILGGTILIIAIGVSRIIGHAHNLTEVWIGLAIGVLSLTVFAQGYLRIGGWSPLRRVPSLAQSETGLRRSTKKLRLVVVSAIVLVLVMGGRKLHAEDHADHVLVKLSHLLAVVDCR
jgi:membrane-associated phospholipid phosphatase